MSKHCGYIYKTTNLITHKIYVGKHKWSEDKRKIASERKKKWFAEHPEARKKISDMAKLRTGELNPNYGKHKQKGKKLYTNGVERHYFYEGCQDEGYYLAKLTK